DLRGDRDHAIAGQNTVRESARMSVNDWGKVNRRSFLTTAAAGVGAGLGLGMGLAQAQVTNVGDDAIASSGSVRNNVSSFRMLNWQQYFDNTRGGAILVDLTSRALHYWSEDQSIYRLYPTSVPL